jgi:aryl-alcohol dehydrogenase-like predicted oxidoreductase
LCRHRSLALMPWSPLGGGVLSGKYRDPAHAPDGTRAAAITNSTATVRRRLADERNQAVAVRVREIAARIGRTPAQVALNWVIHRPAVAAPVVGVRTVAQLVDNLGASGWQLDEPDRTQLDVVSAIDLGYPAEWDARFGIRAGSRPDREVERNN